MARTTRPILALILGAVMLLAACGSSGSSKAGSGATTTALATTTTTAGRYGGAATTTSAPATTSGAVVGVATTSLGATLVDASGHTLYEYQPDPMGSSTCTGPCATLWPALTTTATTVSVGSGVTASLFTVVAGGAGAKVVAVAGHALYRFSGDKNAGDTNGQGLAGVWHVASPNGAPKA
jgi:predicted lipoprotein with Yx(FWY)xxD motif